MLMREYAHAWLILYFVEKVCVCYRGYILQRKSKFAWGKVAVFAWEMIRKIQIDTCTLRDVEIEIIIAIIL